MAKRICWKSGMRLTDTLLAESDKCTSELVAKAFLLATAGRFGLFPSARPFRISIDIDKNNIDILALECLALTAGGHLIDVHYDTRFSNTFATQVEIPDNGDEESAFLLTINASDDKWQDTNDGYCEPAYTFALINEHSPLPANALPLARFVYEYGWSADEVGFVPPCLYISSHPKYQELADRFLKILHEMDTNLTEHIHTDGRNIIRILLPVIRQLAIDADKERDLMTPMTLLASVQKCVSTFLCGCMLDDFVQLSDPEIFSNYAASPYDYRNVHLKIQEGLELCLSINEKTKSFKETDIPAPAPPKPAPHPDNNRRKAKWMGKEI